MTTAIERGRDFEPVDQLGAIARVGYTRVRHEGSRYDFRRAAQELIEGFATPYDSRIAHGVGIDEARNATGRSAEEATMPRPNTIVRWR